MPTHPANWVIDMQILSREDPVFSLDGTNADCYILSTIVRKGEHPVGTALKYI